MIRLWLGRATVHFDRLLLGMLLLVILVALFVLYSASGQNMDLILRQIINILVALVLMWLASIISPQRLESIAVPAYVLGLLLLVGVALFGDVSHGARRWLNLGVASIQPSEGMKLAVPMMLAWYFARREATLRLSDYGVAALLLALPLGFIVKQPDLGTTLLIGASGFYVLFLAGLSWRLMGGMAVTIGAMIPLVWPMLHDYQRKRVLILLDPSQDPLGAGYHTIQATIALGSGGLAGKGWLHGTQAQLDFLPERHTDFIFSVIGEELGFIGALCVLLVFFLFLLRIAKSLGRLYVREHRIAVTGVLSFLAFQVIINVGMNMGMFPTTGIPLPFISYGGSNLLINSLSVGIILKCLMERTFM